MGKKKNLHFGILKENELLTKPATTQEDICDESPPSNVVQPLTANSFASLEAILENVRAPQVEWPMEAFRNVLQRKGRMPRHGWVKAHEIFSGKFSQNISFEEFKKRAMNALTLTSGKKCTIREFKNESTKRQKPIEVLFEEKTLYEAKVQNDVRKVYAVKMAKLKEVDVNSTECTRKISSEKVDLLKLEAVCLAVGEYSKLHPPRSMTDIARTIQAAQQCYQEVTVRQRQKSTWKENIESKIGKLETQVKLLESSKNFEKLKDEDKKSIKKLMRERKLIMGKHDDLEEAIA